MASKIKMNTPSEREKDKIERLKKEWLKNNKPKKCPDAFLDSPYINRSLNYGNINN